MIKLSKHWLTGYLMLIAFQAKILWNFWTGKDLPMGDSAHYFSGACEAFEQGTYSLMWSPLYTWFYCVFLNFSSDPYVVTLGHRFVILCACSILVYEIMRRLLPAPWGLLVALWWLVLPANYDPLYEVHSFAFLFVLLSWLAVSRGNSHWHRSCAVAILALAALLIRNELILMLVPFMFAVAAYEWRQLRRDAEAITSIRNRLATYAAPWPIVLLIVVYFVSRADRPLNSTMEAAREKQAFNFGQIYSFVYSKTNSDWARKNPWTNYQELVRDKFGSTDVTLGSAFFRNPADMARHVATNAFLTVGSLQISLTGARGIAANPDYAGNWYLPSYCWVLTLFFAALLVYGLAFFVCNQRTSHPHFSQFPWLWILLACAVFHGLFVCLAIVPRPAFVFPMNLAIMAVIALGAHLVCERNKFFGRARVLTLPALIFLWCLAPSPWSHSNQLRWNKEAVHALIPHRDDMFSRRHQSVVLTSDQPEPAVRYALRGQVVLTQSLFDILRDNADDTTLSEYLTTKAVWMLHLDGRTLGEPLVVSFIENAKSNGWTIRAINDPGTPEWRLYVRVERCQVHETSLESDVTANIGMP